MHITADGKTYVYDRRLMASEGQLIKRYLGMSLEEFGHAADSKDIDALVGLVWICRRRAGETDLKFSDVDFDLLTLKIEGDEDEETDLPFVEKTQNSPSGSPTTPTFPLTSSTA